MSHRDAVVWHLELQHQHDQGVVVVVAAGRVSSRTCPAFEQALSLAIGSPERGVVLDLSAVDYISSAGLRAIEHAAARLAEGGRPFVLCSLQDSVNVTFQVAGLAAKSTIETTRDAAVRRAALSD